ncbi:hypothetical protein P3T23_000864 [Paraburkholderia sp. GAS448]|uniref:hypothetical protein n=1 Tax=Paraburkholderia sp. GAS448 TaxID=3035136 RepID=UPI003D1B0664
MKWPLLVCSNGEFPCCRTPFVVPLIDQPGSGQTVTALPFARCPTHNGRLMPSAGVDPPCRSDLRRKNEKLFQSACGKRQATADSHARSNATATPDVWWQTDRLHFASTASSFVQGDRRERNFPMDRHRRWQ